MENNKVYLLFDCDEWKSYSSMHVSRPIAVAFTEEDLIPMLIRDLKEVANGYSEENKTLYNELNEKDFDPELISEDILYAYQHSLVDYRSLITLEQGYETN